MTPDQSLPSTSVAKVIEDAISKYGNRILFLTYSECLERLNANLLDTHSLRNANDGSDSGIRIVDIDDDGFMDVLCGGDGQRFTKRWNPATSSWSYSSCPGIIIPNVGGAAATAGQVAQFGIFHDHNRATGIVPDQQFPVTANSLYL